jgi:RNA polymerase sigma-70 factor (ECF subfamily)
MLRITHIGRALSVARREQASFETLIETSWEALWRYAYRLAGNPHDAEDLLSETLIEGFRDFPKFRGETTFVRWMFRIMTTTRIDLARRANVRKAESLDEFGIEAEIRQSGVDRAGDPAHSVLAGILSEPVQVALNALPEEFRAVVILADMEQIDYAEVSRILQIPIGTVRSRLHRGRALLRVSLASFVDHQE